MKTLKTIILASIFAASLQHQAIADVKTSDYYGDYYDEGGALLFKLRGFYTATGAKTKNLPNPTNAKGKKPGRLVQHGLGLDSAAAIFVTDNIATEVSIGVLYYRPKKTVLADAIGAYGSSNQKIAKNNQIYIVPFTITGQYHIAPYGGIRPYFGAGYAGAYMHTRSKAFKIKNDHGPVMQLGVDFISKDDTLITFDVRQYFLKSKLTFKEDFLGSDQDINSKVTWNPLVVSLGFGFKF